MLPCKWSCLVLFTRNKSLNGVGSIFKWFLNISKDILCITSFLKCNIFNFSNKGAV